MHSWQDEAACRDYWKQGDPNDFITGDEELQTKLIQMFCTVCPVADLCLEVQLAVPSTFDWGVWGGTLREARRRIRRRRRDAGAVDLRDQKTTENTATFTSP